MAGSSSTGGRSLGEAPETPDPSDGADGVPTGPVPTPSPHGHAAPDDHAVLRARVAALEAENARLRAAAHTPPAVVPGGSGATVASGGAGPLRAPRRARRVARGSAVVALVVVASLLAPVALASAWARGVIVDTERYLATVAPIIDAPAVQDAVTQRVTVAVVEGMRLEELAADLTAAVGELGLPPRLGVLAASLEGPLVDAVTGRVRQAVHRVVTSDAASSVWAQGHRTVHAQLVAVLRGDPDAVATLEADGTLSVDLGPVVEEVRAALVASGFTLAERIPAMNPTFPLVSSPDLLTLRQGYRALDVLGTWLPWLVLVLYAAAVLVAVHRSRAVVVCSLALAGAMLLLGAAVAVGRQGFTGALPPQVQRPDAAVVVFDQVVSLLRVSLRAVLVLALVAAAVAFLSGRSAAAVAVRDGAAGAAAWLHGAGERRGLSTGPVGAWLHAQRVLVRSTVVVLAAVVLVLVDHPTAGTVLTVGAVAGVVLLVTGLAARPPRPS
ncbi:hypothetical protein GCM10023113_14010 [Cellulomonas oligotrophica]|nr:hypothetical protein Col01nite_28800 [Cellulomonas oligotrophica]